MSIPILEFMPAGEVFRKESN